MDWTPIVTPIATAVVAGLAGFSPSIKRWLDARAKRAENEADAVKLDAQTDAETRRAEVTAKVKLTEAQAEEARVDARKDQALLDDVEALRQEVRDCERERENEKKWCHEQIAILASKIDVLWDRSGLTPKDLPKVTPP
jgi:hypothetical protein